MSLKFAVLNNSLRELVPILKVERNFYERSVEALVDSILKIFLGQKTPRALSTGPKQQDLQRSFSMAAGQVTPINPEIFCDADPMSLTYVACMARRNMREVVRVIDRNIAECVNNALERGISLKVL